MIKNNKELEKLKNQIIEALNASFSGWDFSYINQFGGKPEFPLPWNYKSEIEKYKGRSKSLLDIGTGGGEFLSTLEPFPNYTIATESFKPNIEIAKQKLNPLGIEVIGTVEGEQENASLHFDNCTFDLIINRHTCFDSKEIFRLLKPKGIFITQQVGNRDLEKLVTLFGTLVQENKNYDGSLKNAITNLSNSGLKINTKIDSVSPTRFYDIRTIVYFLKILPWSFPDFNFDNYYQRLENLYYIIKRDGYFEDFSHRYFLVAEKI